eukprot:6460497-Amphidinium_carterae.1
MDRQIEGKMDETGNKHEGKHSKQQRLSRKRSLYQRTVFIGCIIVGTPSFRFCGTDCVEVLVDTHVRRPKVESVLCRLAPMT